MLLLVNTVLFTIIYTYLMLFYYSSIVYCRPLTEGLCLELLRGPAVSGALGYKELCVAAKGEERRLLELKKRQAYMRQGSSQPSNIPKPTATNQSPAKRAESGRSNSQTCYYSGKPGHIARDCRKKKSSESPGRSLTASDKGGDTAGTRKVDSARAKPER